MRRFLLAFTALMLVAWLGCEKLQGPMQPETAPAPTVKVLNPEKQRAQMQAHVEAARTHVDKLIAAYQTARNLKRSRAQNQVAASGNITVPDDYPTIQMAIDNASPGAKIRVKSGAYTEDVVVNVEGVRITAESAVTLNGQFVVTANDVMIDHFSIVPVGSFVASIDVVFASGVEIVNNTINGGIWGAFLIQSTECIVRKNQIGAASIGVYLIDADGNNIDGNTTAAGEIAGIVIQDSDNNQVSGNQCSSQAFAGIWLSVNSSGNEIKHNVCSNNGTAGIIVTDGAHDNIVGPVNTANQNLFGIALDGSTSNNTVKHNTFADNSGLDILNGGTGNTFIKNKASTTSGV